MANFLKGRAAGLGFLDAEKTSIVLPPIPIEEKNDFGLSAPVDAGASQHRFLPLRPILLTAPRDSDHNLRKRHRLLITGGENGSFDAGDEQRQKENGNDEVSHAAIPSFF